MAPDARPEGMLVGLGRYRSPLSGTDLTGIRHYQAAAEEPNWRKKAVEGTTTSESPGKAKWLRSSLISLRDT
ncbi:MAG: hypothetical protein LC808_11605 [Actinobacteria bacterium]|nr:hypothetical protein [Actinomycetota bacterium]